MRICLTSFEYPPCVGGESSYTEGLATSLQGLGHEVTVLTARRDPDSTGGQATGVDMVQLNTSGRRPARIASYQAATAAYLSKHRAFDVVHQTNDYFFPLPSGRKVDLVTMHHPYEAEEQLVREIVGGLEASRYLRRRNMWYLKAMQGIALGVVPRAICVSQFTAKGLGKQYGMPAGRLPVCPNGLWPAEFDSMMDREEARDGLGLGHGYLLLHVGRLDYNKDLATLLDAFAIVAGEFTQCRLAVVGSGPLEHWVRNRVSALRLEEKVVLLGSIDRPTLLQSYAACDVVVLSSLMEGFGIVLAEAMAAGRACVATRCGATPEVVDDSRTGLLVHPRDHRALANALIELLPNPRLLRRFGRAGTMRARALYGWPGIARRILRQYRRQPEDADR